MSAPLHLHAPYTNPLQGVFESRSGGDDAWYAIRVRSNFENSVSDNLQGKGYNVFLPLYSGERLWSDRVKKVTVSLFPGYLFCRFNVQDRLLPILTTPGVVAIVGSGKNPLPVDDHEIAGIHALLRSGLAVRPWPFLAVGSEVYIENGPLAGLEGVITNTDKVYRLILSVSLLGRSVAVEIDREWARPVHSHIGPRALTAA